MRFCFRIGWLAGCSILMLRASGPAAAPQKRLAAVVRADRHSGKLVRTMVVLPDLSSTHSSPAGASAPAAAIGPTVDRIAAQQVLPPELIHSVIKVESNYNPYAVSPKGARGLMQLIPSTARRFGVSDSFDPVENIQGGAKYLKYLLDLYHGDYPLALAAYNAGEEAVARYGGVPPFPETRNYVAQVQKQLAEATAPLEAAPQTVKPAAHPSDPPRIEEIVEPDGSVRYVSH